MYRRRKALAAVAAVIASLAAASSASANTIVVNTAVDQAFVNDGNCSLREALGSAQSDTAANGCTAGSGADTITFNPAVTTINLTPDLAHGGDNNHGPILIQSSITINGPSSGQLTINAPTGGRVMHISSGASTVALSRLDIEGGNPSEDDQALGGGIFSNATSLLSLTHVTVANNTVTATGVNPGNTQAAGGGIYSSGPLMLDHSVVSGNTASSDNPLAADGEAVAQGGGVLSAGGTQIIDSSIDGNTGQATDEQDDGNGGNAARIFGAGLSSGVPLTIQRSAIINNTAAPTSVQGAAFAWGGGIELTAPPSGSATIEQSTIAGNINKPVGSTALNSLQEGAGILAFGVTSVTLQSSTVAANGPNTGSDNNANLAPTFGGTPMTLKNTIVSNPRGATSTNCDGAVTSAGFNIDSGTSCGLASQTTTDQSSTNPALGTLADNGGPTQTMLPQPGSLAIDKGSSVGQSDATHDQRGLARPVDSSTVTNVIGGDGSDIGAVEAQRPTPPTLTAITPTQSNTNFTPTVSGGTDTGPPEGADGSTSSITIYSNASCTTSRGNGSPSTFVSPGIQVTVPQNAVTALYGGSVNAYGIPSLCSSTLSSNGSLTYRHDNIGPPATIDSPAPTTNHAPVFIFHALDLSPPPSYVCSVDTGTPSYSPCTSPFPSPTLGDGSYTFRVKATDALANTGPEATQPFTITTPPPPSTTTPTPTPTLTTPTTPAPKKKCTKAKKGSASAAKKCKKKK